MKHRAGLASTRGTSRFRRFALARITETRVCSNNTTFRARFVIPRANTPASRSRRFSTNDVEYVVRLRIYNESAVEMMIHYSEAVVINRGEFLNFSRIGRKARFLRESWNRTNVKRAANNNRWSGIDRVDVLAIL